MQDPPFAKLVVQFWEDNNFHFLDKTLNLSHVLLVWNRNTFGNIFAKKKKILVQLAGIQRSLDFSTNRFLIDLNCELQEELDQNLSQEETYWKQKSRVKWNQEGNRNTKFFHLSTVISRRKNKIEGLFNKHNFWCSFKNELHKVALEYFEDLFIANPNTGIPHNWPNHFKSSSSRQAANLNCEISLDEVRNALFSIGPSNAPGEDGYPAMFYLHFWHTCHRDIYDTIKSMSLPDSLNNTLITLILKNNNPTSMSNLRPVSLCNTIYKVLAKVIVSCIKPLLQNIISPTQASFVPGRQIVDNIVIVQELLNKFRNSKGKKGFLTWKIDLFKAYDRLSWKFIDDILWEVGLRGKILEVMKMCYRTVSYKVLLNGEATLPFLPHCGLKTG